MLQKLLSLIFPPRESQALLFNLQSLPNSPSTINAFTREITFLSHYSRPVIHAAIVESKYHHNHHAHQLLAGMLTTYLCTTHTPDIVVPIPLSQTRLRERGHNQVTSVLKHTSLPVSDILKRVHAESQTGLNRQERITNVQNAFQLKSPADLSGKHVLLVDDVTTTGTTLTAAAKALATANPASITLVAFAH